MTRPVLWRSRWTAASPPSARAASRCHNTTFERRCRRRSITSLRQATSRWRPAWTRRFGPSTRSSLDLRALGGLRARWQLLREHLFRRPHACALPVRAWARVRCHGCTRAGSFAGVSRWFHAARDHRPERGDVMPLTAGSNHGASSADSDLFVGLTRELLQRGCHVRFRATGTSMHPAIRDGEVVTVAPASGDAFAVGDVLLCRCRPASDGSPRGGRAAVG